MDPESVFSVTVVIADCSVCDSQWQSLKQRHWNFKVICSLQVTFRWIVKGSRNYGAGFLRDPCSSIHTVAVQVRLWRQHIRRVQALGFYDREERGAHTWWEATIAKPIVYLVDSFCIRNRTALLMRTLSVSIPLQIINITFRITARENLVTSCQHMRFASLNRPARG